MGPIAAEDETSTGPSADGAAFAVDAAAFGAVASPWPVPLVASTVAVAVTAVRPGPLAVVAVAAALVACSAAILASGTSRVAALANRRSSGTVTRRVPGLLHVAVALHAAVALVDLSLTSPEPLISGGIRSAAGLATVLALGRAMRHRLGNLAGELLREAFFIAIGVGVSVWALGIEHQWLTGEVELVDALVVLVALTFAVAGAVLAFRFAHLVRSTGAARWLPAATSCGVAAAAVAVVAVAAGHVDLYLHDVQRWLTIAVLGLLGAAATVRPTSVARNATPVVTAHHLGRLRLAMVVSAVLLVPILTLSRLSAGSEVSVPSMAFTTAVLSAAAVAYLGGLMRDWERLKERALHDELTGLPNRRFFSDRLAELVAGAYDDGNRVPAVLFCDLDHFKVVNDSLGHAAGNRLLEIVARRLSETVPEGAMAARLGGDEFAILLDDADELTEVAELLLERLNDPIDIDGRTVRVRCSMGAARFPEDGADPASLLRAADTAMYAAKDLGRNRMAVHTEALRAEAVGRFTIESDLHHALESGQLRLVYQPRVDLRSGEVVGAEALLRWRHPVLGEILPEKFIPVAEESGLIGPLGEWVLTEACLAALRIKKSGHSQIVVSVNISARQFDNPDFAQQVASVLRSTGVDPTCIELELTESLAHHDADGVGATLAELRMMGLRCSIDDFGTGYSGLAYLGLLPLDALKIDKTFVQAVGAERPDGAIGDPASVVTAVIALARAFALRVIAEGVETIDQLEFLIASGCDELQGFIYSPPIEESRLHAMLATRFSNGIAAAIALAAAPAAPDARDAPDARILDLSAHRQQLA